jgi:catechol 2,3-dioxygenase-like lactoylglutathione lyase family enzyme
MIIFDGLDLNYLVRCILASMQIQTVELWVENLDRQAHFYRQTLGLLVVQQPAKAAVEIQAGNTRLILHQSEGSPSGHYHYAFDVPENQFDAAFAWLEQRVQPEANVNGQTHFQFEHWNADSVYFKDPDGNILELIARHNQPNASEAVFSARSILSVSEFGIACNAVPQMVRLLCEGLSVRPYDGAGSEEFTAVGDELGLLIVVRRGRIWMPGVGKEAKFVPFRLEILNEQGKAFAIAAPEYPLIILQG